MRANGNNPMFTGTNAVILQMRLLNGQRGFFESNAVLFEVPPGLDLIPLELRELHYLNDSHCCPQSASNRGGGT